ncbi:DEAD/DEAH box helicase [Brevibacterium sp. 68QC2CO]|nr:DEAD/DEAH box helicase [Brevibacterium sp. 68QC2CO]
MPFKPDEAGASVLDVLPAGFTPYGHQARAFSRLSSAGQAVGERPQPTLVTTGTGSGKTEAFLYPILDHVVRHKRRGGSGVSALILYPMNALATDQAQRLAKLITGNAQLSGIRAAIYTGDAGDTTRSMVALEGLINDREAIRENPPDILLTNYKMLDQLLLRPQDQKLWQLSALSLQYLVLDEFHTYDGAQGTDVAMLLRRLGVKVKSHWPDEHPNITDADRVRPLGRITPVATSATLGDNSESGPNQLLRFAERVFGEPFPSDTVVTESRYSVDEWSDLPGAELTVEQSRLQPIDLGDQNAFDLRAAKTWLDSGEVTGLTPESLALRALATVYSIDFPLPAGTRLRTDDGQQSPAVRELHAKWQIIADTIGADTSTQLALIKQHPFIKDLLAATYQARSQDDLARELLGARDTGKSPERTVATASAYLGHLVAALSVIRAGQGLAAPTVDVHMWIRAVSRIDRSAGGMGNEFSWTDDGQAVVDSLDGLAAQSADGNEQLESWSHFPAIYCRNCGRSGWGVTAGPVGQGLVAQTQDKDIRREKANKNPHFRALIAAGTEADRYLQSAGDEDSLHANLAGFHVVDRELIDAAGVFGASVTEQVKKDLEAGKIEPVLVWEGGRASTDSDQKSVDDYCPACGERDSIRFLGAAVATLLSVTLSTLFGDQTLTPAEKKSLVFTDSVQDAAHRAGFVESRSHVLTRRNIIAHAVGDGGSLDLVADRILTQAGDDPERRYRVLPPEFSKTDRFSDVQAWWEQPGKRNADARKKVAKRLAFDTALEFGLDSRYGRTLSRTGTIAAEVLLPNPDELQELASGVLAESGEKYGELALNGPDDAHPSRLQTAWVRGVAERLRTQGAIYHPWLDAYIADGGFRIWIWGKRKRDQGMPAFPGTRNGPAFAITGSAQRRKRGKSESLFDPVESPQGWYADYTRRLFGLGRQQSAGAVKLLLQKMAQRDLIREFPTKNDSTAKVYGLDATNVNLEKSYDAAAAGSIGDEGPTPQLVCGLCQAEFPLASDALDQLEGTPCLLSGCTGTLARGTIEPNFYRKLYTSSEMHRIVAREHSSILESRVRKAYEDGFKNDQGNPSAPNVLVATPTLEMGIDIGDLSAIMLASLPKTMASYVQRVGRAGRLTGNALSLAFVEGRGKDLPVVKNPLTMINGAVRPPATYLDAVEMIKRQYIAFLIDKLADTQTADTPWPRNASGVFTGDPGQSAFLNRVLELNDAHSRELLNEFLGTFGDSLHLAGDELRAWAVPTHDGAADGQSGLQQMVWEAHGAFNRQLESLQHRLAAIDQALPDLLVAVGKDPEKASDEARRELQEAKAAHGATTRALADARDEYWISALESAQLLPNYTLLDDTAELSVDTRWRDQEMQEYRNQQVSFNRGARLALRDFALGSTFYGRGMQIRIDALDRGPDNQDQYTLALCGQCGYTVELRGDDTAPAVCPRCQDKSIADVGQHLAAVRLRRVSAMVNRDEASITDSDDERRQRSFTVQSLADVDLDQVAERWYVDGYNFGVAYLKNVTITSVNFGPRMSGREVLTGGQALKSPGFVICESCGKQDSQTNGNSSLDHRPWCKHRKAYEEHNVQVVLTHRLRTQGSLVRLPEELLVGDQAALPSLVAAIRLGLSKHLGGDPDHIDVMLAREPIQSGGTATGVADALLLHDTVPGGTGYLADLSRPETVWGILDEARRVVRSCHCQNEGMWACGDCLLPYATYGDTGKVSRASAESLLTKILKAGRGVDLDAVDAAQPGSGQPGTGAPGADSDENPLLWSVTTEAPKPADPDSYLEKSFRKVLRTRFDLAGLDVQERPGPTGVEWTIQQPGSGIRWSLREQETVDGQVRPDFVLRSQLPSIPPVAIFTDGFAYHASHAHNNVADDARKRQSLRAKGYAVVSLTAAEVRQAEEELAAQAGMGASSSSGAALGGLETGGLPVWFDQQIVARILNQARYGWTGQSESYLHNPIDLLVNLVQSASRDAQEVPQALRYAANGMPMFFFNFNNPVLGARPVVLPPKSAGPAGQADLAQVVLGQVTGTSALDPMTAPVDANGNPVRGGVLCTRGPLTVLVEIVNGAGIDVAVVLDDRDSALDDPQFATAWAEWLYLSNLCSYRQVPHHTTVASVQQLLAELPVTIGDVASESVGGLDFVEPQADIGVEVDTAQLSGDWKTLLESGELEPAEKEFVLQLHAAGVTAVPDVGEESENGVPMDLSWPQANIVVLLDPEDGDAEDLQAEGWTVVSAQADKVKEALMGTAAGGTA